MERVALAIWNERISPVFDVSRRLLVLEIDAGLISSRTEVALDPDEVGRKAARLAEHQIQVLICGSISRCLAGLLESRGIRLLSFVTGPVEEVITAYLEDALPHPRLIMPGCCCARWRQQGGSGVVEGFPRCAPATANGCGGDAPEPQDGRSRGRGRPRVRG